MGPMSTGTEFVERFYELLGAGDVEGVVGLYADDGEIVRYDGVADDPGAIGDYYRRFLERHAGVGLRQIVQLREVDDVVMWDALVDTDNGVLQTVHVIMLDENGRIRRHIPGLRGYWGK